MKPIWSLIIHPTGEAFSLRFHCPKDEGAPCATGALAHVLSDWRAWSHPCLRRGPAVSNPNKVKNVGWRQSA